MKTLSATYLFALATLTPVLPLLLGALLGGPAVWVGLVTMTLLVSAMDRIVAAVPTVDQEFPSGETLSLGLFGAHILLLSAAVFGLGHATLTAAEHAGIFAGVGLWLGQVGNSNAHELIHRPDRLQFRLGRWLFVSLLFGHHTSAHTRVHHRYVGSDLDPNTARLGESFPAFAIRAWIGSFRSGYTAESALRRDMPRHRALLSNPYVLYCIGALTCLGLAFAIGGWAGLLWYVALCGFAQMQLLLSDYVQHYGLKRREIAPGRLEPVSPAHSWNAPHAWSGALMLNAPRHSDHHINPSKPYPSLELSGALPMLPRALPVMAVIALWPPLWHRVMDRRVAKWAEASRHKTAA